MNSDEIKQKLAELDPDIVKDFVLNLYLQYPELNAPIETLVLINDPAAFAKAISKRIGSVSRGRKFIDWRMSAPFSRDLDAIMVDIETGLLAVAPKKALDLITKFLATADKVFGRVDDSSGDVGYVYHDAVLLWLNAAQAWRSTTKAGKKINWLERVYDLYLDNDYSVYDALLPNSAILLNHDELTQLAWRYESELRQAQKMPNAQDSFNMAALKGGVALGAVAEALKDPKLYERATTIDSPVPNELQKQSIIKMYLKFDQVDEAMGWLKLPWGEHFESDRLCLLDEAYQQSGNVTALKQIRYEVYLREKDYANFARYLECLSDEEKSDARLEAIQQAELGDELTKNVDMLLCLEEVERAQQQVLARPDELANCFYGSLLEIAKQFETQQYWLAATACYRCLLWDILEQARSKAYTHAARYFKKLKKISQHVQTYEPLLDEVEFVTQLKEKHGRKRSFWDRVL